MARSSFERALIVVEGLYSMDGDYPDLPRLIEIKSRHNAWLNSSTKPMPLGFWVNAATERQSISASIHAEPTSGWVRCQKRLLVAAVTLPVATNWLSIFGLRSACSSTVLVCHRSSRRAR